MLLSVFLSCPCPHLPRLPPPIPPLLLQPTLSPQRLTPQSMPLTPLLNPRLEEPLAPGFGWVPYAERINGRFAMVGFVALLLLELITGQDFFTWLGLR